MIIIYLLYKYTWIYYKDNSLYIMCKNTTNFFKISMINKKNCYQNNQSS